MSTPTSNGGECTSFEKDIRSKFTNEDVEHMNDFGMDLGDYATVKENADSILTRLLDDVNPMPPRPRGPWSKEWIDCFRQWIDGGMLP